jgi:hypothetical protein
LEVGGAAADAAACGSRAAAHVTVLPLFCFFRWRLSWHAPENRCCLPATARAPLIPPRRGVAAVPLRVAIISNTL